MERCTNCKHCRSEFIRIRNEMSFTCVKHGKTLINPFTKQCNDFEEDVIILTTSKD